MKKFDQKHEDKYFYYTFAILIPRNYLMLQNVYSGKLFMKQVV